MPYEELGKARPRRELREDAISLAMQSRWEEAVSANRNLIEGFPTDVDAFNRLGRALTELGRFAEAKEAYAKALELAPGNAIARKNLDRLSLLRRKQAAGEPAHRTAAPQLFVGEVGKYGIVGLYHLASMQTLAKMAAGDQVFLKARKTHLVVENADGEPLGWVEPKYEMRLLKLMAGGNEYAAAIVSVNGEAAKVIITEAYQHPSQVGRLSFPNKVTAAFRSLSKDSLLRRGVEEEGFEEFEFAEETEEEGEALPQGFSVVESTAAPEEEEPGKEGSQ